MNEDAVVVVMLEENAVVAVLAVSIGMLTLYGIVVQSGAEGLKRVTASRLEAVENLA